MKYLNQIISEIRKSEKVLGRIPKVDYIGHTAAIAYIESNNIDIYNTGITMTKIPKVGINPRSIYNTPIGIYFYPTYYYIDVIKNKEDELPFQHNAKLINILEYNKESRILELSNIENEELQSYYSTLKELPLKFITTQHKNFYISYLEDMINEAPSSAKVKTNGGEFWYVLYKLSEYLSLASKDYFETQTRSHIIWNWLLRKLGFDIILDDGDGIIHYNEPMQGLALSKSSIKWIKTIDNTNLGEIRKKNINKNLEIFFSSKTSDYEKLEAIKKLQNRLENEYDLRNKVIKYINNSNDEMKYKFVKEVLPTAVFDINLPKKELDKLAYLLDVNGSYEFLDDPREVILFWYLQRRPSALYEFTKLTDLSEKFFELFANTYPSQKSRLSNLGFIV